MYLGGKNAKPLPPPDSDDAGSSIARKELDGIKDSLIDEPVASLRKLARTVDQARAGE